MISRLSLTGVAISGLAAAVAFAMTAPAAVAQSSSAQRDPVATGKALFLRCAACHATSASAPAKVGPHLQKIVGRRAGSVQGFAYSEAMKKSQITWNAAQLDRFLTRPATVVPGTSMAFGGIPNEAQRKALIAYLQSLK